MKQINKKVYLVLFFFLLFVLQEAKAEKKQPNIIFMIGDGMGLAQISLGYYRSLKPLSFLKFKTIGLMETSSQSDTITDSAAGATAFACGEKTYNGAIGLSMAKTSLPNLVEILSKKGYSTAVISTSSVTHATPASFYAHVEKRKEHIKIAEQLLLSEIDYFAGGGKKYFPELSKKFTQKEMVTKEQFLISSSFPIKEKELAAAKKVGYLLAEDGMPTMEEGRKDFLTQATKEAITFLEAKGKPFFIMVEGSQIDWGGHANNTQYVLSEFLDFDATVGECFEKQKENANTLLVVTGDHETGGLALATKGSSYHEIETTFATKGHTAMLIPVFAAGVGAERFSGMYENTEVFSKIMSTALEKE